MNKPITTIDRPDDQLRRTLIDLIGESRSRAVRVALFGEMLYRPDPAGLEKDADRANSLKVLTDTVRWLDRTHVMLATLKDPWDEFPPELVGWLKQFVTAQPEVVELLDGMQKASQRVAVAAEARSADLGPALRAHYELRRGPYMAAVTQFCARIWNQIDTQREAEMATATRAIATTRKALERMEQIATHVRLVAINAAIEANKLGDDGRGIAFIAAEFKTLAEELQSLSANARSDISGPGTAPGHRHARR